jgi:L-amino acid N-acyltransferase YncA
MENKVIIRPVKLSDAQSLHRNCFTYPPLESVEKQIADIVPENQTMFVAEYDGEVVGVAIGIYNKNHMKMHAVYVCSVVVKKEMQGRGIAKDLVNAVTGKAKEDGKILALSETDTANPMQNVFIKCGFTHSGTIPKGIQRSWTNDPHLDEMIFYKEL